MPASSQVYSAESKRLAMKEQRMAHVEQGLGMECNRLRQECESMNVQLGTARTSMKHTSWQRDDMSRRAEQNAQELDSTKAELAEVKLENADMRVQLAQMQAMASQKVAKAMEAMDEERKRLRKEILEANEEINRRYDMCQAAEAAKKAAEDALNAFKKENQGNRDKVAALEKKNRVLESELHDAKKTIKNLEAAAGDSAGDIKKLKATVKTRDQELVDAAALMKKTRKEDEDRFNARTAVLQKEHLEMSDSLKTALVQLKMAEANCSAAEIDLADQKNLVATLRKSVADLKASALAERDAFEAAKQEAAATIEALQLQCDRMEARVADVAKDEELLQRALESSLQSATELREAPEDVRAEVRHGAWIGLYRGVGRILDSKFPLGKNTLGMMQLSAQ